MDYEDWEASTIYADETLLAEGYSEDVENALEAPKAPRYEGLCYMVAYRGAKPVIARVKGKRIVEIYKRRNFVEIEKSEFDRLVKVLKGE